MATYTWYYWSSSSSSTSTTDTWYDWSFNASPTTIATTTSTWTVWQQPQTTYTHRTSGSGWKIPKKDFIQEHYKRMQRTIDREWGKYITELLKQEKEAAEKKAERLLLDLISEKEFELYKKTGRLLVKGRENSYILRKSGGVAVVQNGHKAAPHESLCVHLNYADMHKCPETDNVIALKLHIEHCEKQFLKTANHHGHRQPTRADLEFLEAVNG